MSPHLDFVNMPRKLFRPRWGLATLLVLLTLFGIVLAIYSAHYRRTIGFAKKIDALGGSVMFHWEQPFELPMAAAFDEMRRYTKPDGSEGWAIAPPIHYKSIIRDRRLNYTSGGPKDDPVWSIFDFENDWEICYVNLPLESFDQKMLKTLRGLPKLQYVDVIARCESDEPKAHRLSADQEKKLRTIIEALPELEVLCGYHVSLMKRDDMR